MLHPEYQDRSTERLAAASEAARLRGDYEDGVRLARQAAELAALDHRPDFQSEMLCLVANQEIRLGNMEAAASAAGEAARLAADSANQSAHARALVVQAHAYLELGLPEEALEALAISLEAAQRLRDPDLLFWSYNRIGTAQGHLGKHLQSRDFLRRALPLSAGLGAEAKFCILNNLADNAANLAFKAREQHDAALEADAVDFGLRYARDAIELARAAAHPYREAICLGNYGTLLSFSHDQAGASQAFTRSHAIACEKGYTSLILDARFGLARLAMLCGESSLAIDRFETALPDFVDNDERPLVIETHRLLSDLYQQIGQPAQALSHFKSYHTLESGMRSSVAETRSRMVTSMTELSAALLEAERARLEANLHRMRLAEMETERHDLQLRTDDLDRKAHEDDLTGLKNRRYALGALTERIGASPPGQQVFAAIVDADHFKSINDRFGHLVGDQVLQALAGLLQTGIGPDNLAARLGGEEFLLVLTGTAEQAIALCETLIASIAHHGWQEGLTATVSIGLAAAAPGEAAHDLLGRADGALYRSKSGGRNRLTADLWAPAG
jgi:diguanylate cyclase (GGDEF)-like protein